MPVLVASQALAAKPGRLNSDSGTMGSAARRWLHSQTGSKAAAAAPIKAAVVVPRARLRVASKADTSRMANSSAPRQSSGGRSAWCWLWCSPGCTSGSTACGTPRPPIGVRARPAQAPSAKGTATKKVQRHDRCWVTKAPASGPPIVASP